MKKNILVIIASLLFSIILWVSISLSSEYYYTIKLPVKLVNFPEGYSSGSKLPNLISVKIKGKGWNILPLNLKTNMKYYVSAAGEPGYRNASLLNSISENSWITSDIQLIGIKPDSISFLIEKISQKAVRIIPDINLNFKANYGLASAIKIYPETTMVYGPKSFLKNMNEIHTQKMYYYKLDQKISEKIPLTEIDGYFFHDNSVRIDIDVQQIVEKTVDNVFVEVRNVPKREEVVLIPNKISIGLKGGIDVLGKITASDLKPFVKYEDLVKEDGELTIVPQLNQNPDVKTIFLKPDELKFVIKKF
jgi:hypothetical protein